MRTTLTIDADVAELLDQSVRREGRTLKEIVNDALRRGLGHRTPAPLPPYVVRPHVSALRPGLDPGHMGRLLDELDTEAQK